MPSADAILAGATTIANEWRTVAVAWHVVLAVVLTAVFCGWRPSNRVTACVLSSPFLSVSAAAWVWGNPFNGTVFAALSVFLIALASRLSKDPVRFGAPILAIPGAILVAFGWGYPHFLETNRWMTYAYAAPLGVLPCPTLSAVIGATLILGLLGSVTWSIKLAVLRSPEQRARIIPKGSRPAPRRYSRTREFDRSYISAAGGRPETDRSGR